jgi:transposase
VRRYLQAAAKSPTTSTPGSAVAEPKSPTISTPGKSGSPPSSALGPEWVTAALVAEAGRPSHCAVHQARIETKLEEGLSAQRIYQDLVAEVDFSGSYQSVKRFVRQLRDQTPERVWRIEVQPGEEVQIDFGTGAPVIDAQGRRRRPWVLRVVLSFSRKAYSEAVFQQTTENLIRCLENAFRAFGGVSQIVNLDYVARHIIGNYGAGQAAEKVERMTVTRNPVFQLLVGEGLHVRLIAEAQHRDKQRGLTDRALGVVNWHFQSRPIHEELLARRMHLPQDRIQLLGPIPIQLAVLAAVVTLGVSLMIFLPQQLQGDALAAELFVQGGPVGQRLGRATRRRRIWRPQQTFGELGVGNIFRQRPGQPDRFRPLEVIAHRAGRQATAAGDLTHRQLILMFESKDVFYVTHVY